MLKFHEQLHFFFLLLYEYTFTIICIIIIVADISKNVIIDVIFDNKHIVAVVPYHCKWNKNIVRRLKSGFN